MINNQDLNKIENVKNILNNLESEISIANKNLKTIRLETERAIIDSKFEQDKLETLTKKCAELNTTVNSLSESRNNLSSDIAKLQQEIISAKSIHDQKINDLNNREISLATKEEENYQIRTDLDKLGKELDSSKSNFEAKRKTLKDLIETF